MFDEIIRQMRDAALGDRVYLVIHANRELKADNFEYDDVINCLLSGEIVGQQFDTDRQEEKYVIYGDARNGDEIAVIAKLGYNGAAVVITVYRLPIMTSENNAQVCINCGKQVAYEIRRDELFGSGENAVIVENIPMVKCLSCGMVYLEPEVSRRIDEVCAHPEQYASVVEKQVARIA